MSDSIITFCSEEGKKDYGYHAIYEYVRTLELSEGTVLAFPCGGDFVALFQTSRNIDLLENEIDILNGSLVILGDGDAKLHHYDSVYELESIATGACRLPTKEEYDEYQKRPSV